VICVGGVRYQPPACKMGDASRNPTSAYHLRVFLVAEKEGYLRCSLHQSQAISSATFNFVGQNEADENTLFISSAT
jgi:hypothetical protein